MILLSICAAINGKDMLCHYETSVDFVGFQCDLKNQEEVLPGSEDEGYYFTGLNTYLKERFDKIFFYTENISFVPKEVFEVFPNLRKIGFWGADLRKIEYDWLTEFLKYEKGLNGLVFHDCHINEIEPRVMEIFTRYQSIKLSGNDCIDDQLEHSDTEIATINSQLQTCFKNYRINDMEKTVFNMAEKFDKFQVEVQTNFDEINQKLNKLLGETEDKS